jgi:hypothetical protein
MTEQLVPKLRLADEFDRTRWQMAAELQPAPL